MEDHGITILTIMSDIKTKAEDSVELALSQQAIIQRIFQDQIEATSKLVNATRQAYTDVLWGSIWSMNWLGIVMALKPCYKYCKFSRSVTTYSSFQVDSLMAITLLQTSRPLIFAWLVLLWLYLYWSLVGLNTSATSRTYQASFIAFSSDSTSLRILLDPLRKCHLEFKSLR